MTRNEGTVSQVHDTIYSQILLSFHAWDEQGEQALAATSARPEALITTGR